MQCVSPNDKKVQFWCCPIENTAGASFGDTYFKNFTFGWVLPPSFDHLGSSGIIQGGGLSIPASNGRVTRPSVTCAVGVLFRGPATNVLHSEHFCFLKKRWQPNRTAEPEVQAVPPLRHPPSARKSRWHPSLRPSPAEPFCLLPDGSTRCPTISGCTKS